MLLSRYVFVTINPGNIKYWKNLGYKAEPKFGRGHKCICRIKVSINHIVPGSKTNVSCRCNECEKKYIQRFSRNKEICRTCRQIKRNSGNIYGTANKGRKDPTAAAKLPHYYGKEHPRWNPNKKEYREYWYQVSRITEETYKNNKDIINPNNYPRTLCGIEGGYQLDHIISIKKGFIEGIDPTIMGALKNLQMLPWKENRTKHGK